MLFNWLTVVAAAQTDSFTFAHPLLVNFISIYLHMCVWVCGCAGDLHHLGWTRNYDSLLWRTLSARSSFSSPRMWGTSCGFVKLAHRLFGSSLSGPKRQLKTCKIVLIFESSSRWPLGPQKAWLNSHEEIRHAAGCLWFGMEIELLCATTHPAGNQEFMRFLEHASLLQIKQSKG